MLFFVSFDILSGLHIMYYYRSITVRPLNIEIALLKWTPWLRHSSTDLKGILAQKIPKHNEMVKKFRKSHGKTKVGEVILNQLYGGMRGIKGLICETSLLDPNEGIRFRGLSIPECIEKLPRVSGSQQPLPEAIFWLMITGDVPSSQQTTFISQEWAKRSHIPEQTIKVMENLKKIHPMGQLCAAVISMTSESKFRKAIDDRVGKTKLWEYVYEDVMDLLGKLNVICARIYTNTYKGGGSTAMPDPSKDWSFNYGKMMGYSDKEFIELLRLYLTIHTDHEGGNVSAHTCHLVGSALSDPYLSYAAGMLGLAGPLHGLANQEVLVWLNDMMKKVGDKYTEQQVKDFIWATLKSGNVVPGYGHAVLRKTDPRYICQKEFAQKHMPNDKLCKLVHDLYKIVPPILTELGKVANPWPNVDAHSGVLLQHYGMTEMNYYTVMFSLSRAIGVLAQLVWSRGMLLPIERPKSFTTEHLMKELKAT